MKQYRNTALRMMSLSGRKKVKAGLTLILMLSLLFCMSLMSIASEDEYEYTIRVYAGAKGTFDDGSEVKVIKAKYGETVNLSTLSVTPNENRYLFSGYRQSGRDNRWAEMPAFEAEKDVDYVVAYSIRGQVVHYTLNFVEYGTGATLMASLTLEGNVGDKPIEAFRYIEGYRPVYRNLTKTLSENEADNVFTFEYVALTAEEAAGGAGADGGAGAGAGAGGAGAGGAGAEAGAGDENGTPQTQNINDLDTPLAGPGRETETSNTQGIEHGSRFLTPILIIICAAVAAVLIVVLIILLAKRRKKKK